MCAMSAIRRAEGGKGIAKLRLPSKGGLNLTLPKTGERNFVHLVIRGPKLGPRTKWHTL